MKRPRNYTSKLFLAYSTAILLVLLLLFSFVLFFLFREQYSRSTDTQSELVFKIQEQTDASLQGMDRIINGLLFNRDFVDIMQSENPFRYYTSNSKSVLNSFVALDAPLFTTRRIIAFDKDIYYSLSKTGEDQIHIKQAIQNYNEWDAVTKAEGHRVILPVRRDPFDSDENIVYSVARSISDEKNTYGVIEVQNSYSKLEGFCSLDASLGQVAMFSAGGDIVFPFKTTSGEENFGAKNLFEEVKAQGKPHGTFVYDRQQVSFRISEYSGWVTLLYTPVGSVVPYAVQLIAATIIAFLVLSGVTLVMLRIITKRLMAPLVHLNDAVSRVSLDNLSLELPEANGIHEIENINSSFKTMFDHLKTTIAESIQARAGEERANYLALQSQMNPHTIYNTITMIESVSYMHGDKEVSNLCICFSQMLRYISDFTKREYTVQDELAHLESYDVLITTRYKGRLEIKTSVENKSLREKIIPKFTLQPLVENAVKHGFGYGVDSLKISLEISQLKNGWQVFVYDNGCGFSSEAIEEINRQLKECDESLAGGGDVVNRKIGHLSMSNIYIRCRILYGENFEFNVGNNSDGGAFVKLCMQEKTEEAESENIFSGG